MLSLCDLLKFVFHVCSINGTFFPFNISEFFLFSLLFLLRKFFLFMLNLLYYHDIFSAQYLDADIYFLYLLTAFLNIFFYAKCIVYDNDSFLH